MHARRPAALQLALRWALFAVLLLGFILLPFVVLEGTMNALVEDALRSERSLALVTLAAVVFLLVDIVLPIPSSFVLTSTGFLLGAGAGTVAGFVGLSCASAAGYLLGRVAGVPIAERIVGREQLARFGALSRRHGDVLLVAFRAMPVLAEASTLLAGTTRMAPLRFAVLVSVGNAVVAALYAGIGAYSASQSSVVLVSLAAMAVPVLIVLAMRRAWPGPAVDEPPR